MSDDLLEEVITRNPHLKIYYFKSLVDGNSIHRDILPYINDFKDLQELEDSIPVTDCLISATPTEIFSRLLAGNIAFRLENENKILLINASTQEKRAIGSPEVEFSVVGPQESFVENITTNLNLIRKRLPRYDFMVKEFTIGTVTKTKVVVAYLEDIASDQNVQTVMQRLENIDYDEIIDVNYINQLIQDQPMSIFPQLINTERPDRVVAALTEGKVVIMSDGSPHGLIAPVTFTEFFFTIEDYNLNWITSSAIRIVRFIAIFFSMFATPTYVAVLTYHYEIIPKDLLQALISSRSAIPFPPIIEAVILELAIELLREAGARLPTKVGQTLGIVGGIVIGQASVEAGLTSNILLIIVAMAALASFTTPIYKMGNTIRIIRFPILVMAQLLGLVGILLFFTQLLIHLLRLSSLGNPFMEPIFPPRLADMKDFFIRLPLKFNRNRPAHLRTKQPKRFGNIHKKPVPSANNDFYDEP
ncbi:spore germination protein [Peribacillus acanthi]|uniref:spore germination protein n=1 Tax=Peribacillus acanthi TaxID=2171554 RepID=UPI003B833556